MRTGSFQVISLVIAVLLFCTSITGRSLKGQNQKSNDSVSFHRLSTEIVDPAYINWPTFNGVHQTGKINATFNCFGTFGTNFSGENIQNEWPGIVPSTGFITPADSSVEYLYGGAVWIGGIVGGDTLVSVGFDGWQSNAELSPPGYPLPGSRGTVDKIDFIANFSMRAEFTDTVAAKGSYSIYDPAGHRPLNIKVASRSHTWHSSPQNNIIIYDVVISNVGSQPINDGYIGLYFDCDVGSDLQNSWLDDLTGSFRNQGIGYIIDNDGDIGGSLFPATRIFAFKFLGQSFTAKDTSYNWWIGNVSPALDFGPRQRETAENPFRDFGTGGLGTPEGDANKYYMMRFREWDYDQIYTYSIGDSNPTWLPPNPALTVNFSVGWDTRFLMSIGSFQLPPDSSIRILFSTFTGDYVHTTSGSINYLPHDPATYLSLLYFNDVIANSIRADSLAGLILNPQLPPMGLQLVRKPDNSNELQWDPWVYNDISGYFLFVSEPNLDLLPNPGAIPPWWTPDTNITPARIDKTYKITIDSLDHNKNYIASIAHRFANERGQLSSPLLFKINDQSISPPVVSRHAFANPGGPLYLKWAMPEEKAGIDHYNIYKFPNKTDALQAYHAFYDEGYFSIFVPPVDSHFIEEKKYYFYSMQPFAVASADDTLFLDYNFTEGDVYLITSTDEYGFESQFTKPITANIVDEFSKDILLITHSSVTTPNNFTNMDSVYAFYGRILNGYDYDVYVHRDSTHILNCPTQSFACMDWHDFMKYKMIIIDDHLSETLFSNHYQDSTDGFVRYLEHGGKFAYFGRFRGYGFMNQYGTLLNYADINHEFVNDFLGIDSIHIAGERYYSTYSIPPQIDTLFGFIQAISMDSNLQTLTADTLHDPFTPRLRNIWTPKTPPGVATFKINDNSTCAMLYSSIYPYQSIQHDHIIGVRRNFPELNTYAYTFGFHLWYMDSTDARNLIESLFAAKPAISAHTHIEPFQFHTAELNDELERLAYVYLGNLSQTRTVNEINNETLTINNVISATPLEIVSNLPGYDGQVLKMLVPVRNILLFYYNEWDTLNSTYNIHANLTDGFPLKAVGDITIIGRLHGDINNDDAITVLDLTILINYLFRGTMLPEPKEAADADISGSINILDLTRLVDIIFRGEN